MAKPSTSLLKRRLDIAEIVRKNGEIKVDDLAEMLAVSGVTIRNDLNYLEQQGYLKRSFGGAIYTAQAGAPVAMTREAPAVRDKALETEMARQVAAQIENGETLFLGQGSILRKVIPFLANREELCLLLNDLGHVALAQEFFKWGNRSAWRGVVRSGADCGGRTGAEGVGSLPPFTCADSGGSHC
ncbi:Transcriptional repressor of aga operon [Klebsiella pneumoniae IS43]|uniref:Transcriptional repressor of aga operon n=1 Tax=Klebsiella pneumoniae IS43 TaxID=1432552 RepID=W1DMB8_KLEPN|nr:Transcriptional repressor of aga operon [Klebsiella pneumoniae IS43]